MQHAPVWPDRTIEKLQLSAYLGDDKHCNEEHNEAITRLASQLMGRCKGTKMRQIMIDASHQAEALGRRFKEDKARIAEHERKIRRQENESELITKLNELTQQSEATLMKQLMAQFDSMKRDIRQLKQRGGGSQKVLESPKNSDTIDEAGVTEWFIKHGALRKEKTSHEVTVGTL